MFRYSTKLRNESAYSDEAKHHLQTNGITSPLERTRRDDDVSLVGARPAGAQPQIVRRKGEIYEAKCFDLHLHANGGVRTDSDSDARHDRHGDRSGRQHL